MSFKFNTITAIVGVDTADGDEGIWGFYSEGGWVPMIAADENRLMSILPMAEKLMRQYNRPYRILRFSHMEDVTELMKAKYLHSNQSHDRSSAPAGSPHQEREAFPHSDPAQDTTP